MSEEAQTVTEAQETADFLTMTVISVCYAAHCRFNVNHGCIMRKNEIAKNGQCMNFEVRNAEHIRKNLEARGLPPEEIKLIMAEVEKKEEAEDVPH